MYYQDHEPAHFRAEYQGQQGTFRVDGEPLAGEIRSGTARRLIRDWAQMHRADLDLNWARARARAGEPLSRVEPLE